TRRDLQSVLFLYERVIREAPDRAEVRRKLVDVCLELDRFGDAVIHARALLEKEPSNGELWDKLGLAQAGQNKLEESRQSFLQAIECAPTNIRSYEFLAELLIGQMQRADEARDCINKMVRVNPSNGEAYLVRARYYRGQNKTGDCLNDLGRLLEIDPENADGL